MQQLEQLDSGRSHLLAVSNIFEEIYDMDRLYDPTLALNAGSLIIPRTLYGDQGIQHTTLAPVSSKWEHITQYQKKETEQIIRAFKIRGAFIAADLILQERPDTRELVAASAGNHGLGVAQYVRWHNTHKARSESERLSAHIFCAKNASSLKKQQLRNLGVFLHDQESSTLEDAMLHATRYIQSGHDKAMIHPYADPRVIAGQSLVLAETVCDLPEDKRKNLPLTFYVAGGGFGLANGSAALMGHLVEAKQVHPDSRVVAVQMEHGDAHTRALGRLAAGILDLDHLFDESNGDLFDPSADGTAVRTPDMNNLFLSKLLIRRGLLDVTTVSREGLAVEMQRARQRGQILEPAGALADAGYQKYASKQAKEWITHPPELDSIVVTVQSGANCADETAQLFEASLPKERGSLNVWDGLQYRVYVYPRA